MSLRFRLALFSSLVALAALALLVVFSGLALQRSLLRDLDEELRVQSNVILQDVIQDGTITQDTETALTTTSGSSTAWIYKAEKTDSFLKTYKLNDAAGKFNAPEPLDKSFFHSFATISAKTVEGWRVSSIRQNDILIQVGRSTAIIERTLKNYVRNASLIGVLAALLAGAITTLVVGRTTEPLEQLVQRLENLESNEPIPALNNTDEVGALARALASSLENLKQTRANESRFLADAAHELRTPIAAMMADLGHHRERARSQAEDAAVIHRAQNRASHLRELTNNLLTLTQTQRQLSLQHQKLEVFALVAQLVDKYAVLASSKNIEMDLEGEPAWVMGDPLMLERAVSNLIGNAIKFTDHGEIRVFLTKNKTEAKLTVQDTGIGIEAQVLSRVFEAFERGNVQHGERMREGSGLGLAVVKAVTEIHGGRVELQSQLGIGSQASIVLPLAEK